MGIFLVFLFVISIVFLSLPLLPANLFFIVFLLCWKIKLRKNYVLAAQNDASCHCSQLFGAQVLRSVHSGKMDILGMRLNPKSLSTGLYLKSDLGPQLPQIKIQCDHF